MSLVNVDTLSAINEHHIQQLATQIRGDVIRPDDAGYDAARRVWNGMIDKHPALIVRCNGTADVVAAVRFANEHDLLVAVRGGGHNVAGSAVCDGGIVIDLSPMKGIQVDLHKRLGRAQGGVTWNELDRETQLFGLATTGGEVSPTGIAGYTLSGGMGMLQRKFGLACDNLLSVEIVTADGNVVRASVTEHPDLFWAVRGGGGNFGVVTWFEFQLHPVGPRVYGFGRMYPASDAPKVLRAWRSFAATAPDDITSQVLFWGMPPELGLPEDMHGMPIVVIFGMYAGSVEEGEQAFAALNELGDPIVDLSGVSNYVESQSAFDIFFPDGGRYYWKSLFLDELSDQLIDAIIEAAASRPTPQTLMAIRHLGGAISRRPEDATAYGNRRATFNLSLDAIWDDPADDERNIAWSRRSWTGLREQTGGGVYLNFAGLGEDNDLLARAGYGRNYDRLREVKRRYDPANLFRGNINVTPS